MHVNIYVEGQLVESREFISAKEAIGFIRFSMITCWAKWPDKDNYYPILDRMSASISNYYTNLPVVEIYIE
jgi:hypothetical protein